MSSSGFDYVEFPKDLVPEVSELPGDLCAVAEIVGVPLTLKLAQRFRSSSVYFHNIDNLLRQQRNIQIRNAYDHGVPVDRLSRQHRISVRQIWNILGSMD